MVAPIKFLSGRQQQQKIGVEGSTENEKVLEVIGRVGIGTTIFEPSKTLDVRGSIHTRDDLFVDTGSYLTTLDVSGISTFASDLDINASIDVDGHTELDDLNVSGIATFLNNVKVNTATLGTRGTNNLFFGFGALNTVTAGINCVAIGVQALNSNNGNDNIAIGYRALYNNQSANNTAIGFRALENNQGLSNTAIGYWAIRDNTTGAFNSALGNDALFQNISGNNNVAMGKRSAGENLSGSYNIHLGSYNGNTTNRSGIVVIGSGGGNGVNAFDVPKDANNQLAIGRNISGTNNYWIVGDENYNIGIGTTNPTAKLDVGGNLKVSNNIDVNTLYVSGVSTFIGGITGTISTATKLENARTFEITGDVVASPISFDGTGNVSLAATIQPNSVGLGTDTFGDYVASISGTANQIAVDVTSGEGTTPTLSVPNQFTTPQDATVTRDLNVLRDLNVTGNITVGGTSATIFTTQLQVEDADLILGVRTDGLGNDIANDTTANHGGIAIASTEGNPLVDLYVAGIETVPTTYKKIMWFKAGTFAGLGTDAWLSNYAVGIGSTQFPTGTRLAVGGVQLTDNDIIQVRNINASGISTIPILKSTNIEISGISTFASDLDINASVDISNDLNVSGVSTFASDLDINASVDISNDLNVSGVSTFASDLDINASIDVDGHTELDDLNVSGISTFASDLDINASVDISNDLNVSGVSTFADVVSIGATVGIGTIIDIIPYDTLNNGTLSFEGSEGQLFSITNNLTSGSIFSVNPISGIPIIDVHADRTIRLNPFGGNVGVGTTNPIAKLDVNGSFRVSGVSTFQDDVSIGAGGTTAFFDVSTGNIGIGTDNPQAKLDVNSDIKINDITVGRGGGDVSTNTVLGYQALESNTTGQYNVATGYQALYTNNGGSYNVANGFEALYSNTTGFNNVATGRQALRSNTTGIQNVANGYQALLFNNASNNVATGFQALYTNTIGDNNTATGYRALYDNTIGTNNVAYGFQALNSNTTGNFNSHYGSFTGISTNASRRIVIGSGTDGSNLFDTPDTTKDTQLAIGHNVSGTSSYWIVGDENYNIGIGTTNPTAKLDVEGNLKVSGIITTSTYDTLYTSSGSVVSTSSTTSQVGIHSTLSITSYRSVEYTIQATQANNFHATKILALHDGTIAYPSEYGTIFNNTTIASFDIDVSGGNIRLLSTPASSGITTYTINFTATKL